MVVGDRCSYWSLAKRAPRDLSFRNIHGSLGRHVKQIAFLTAEFNADERSRFGLVSTPQSRPGRIKDLHPDVGQRVDAAIGVGRKATNAARFVWFRSQQPIR